MPNHIHLLIKQTSDESINRFIHRLHTSYTMYFNIKYERVGSVFQGRFKAKLIESDEYLLHVSRYIHQNPLEVLRAQGPALKLENYMWSSYQEYIGVSSHSLCETDMILSYVSQEALKKQQLKYRQFVEEGLSSLELGDLEDISSGKLPELKAGP